MEVNVITEKIIGCAYAVSNTLGVGFLEKVYENALAFELRDAGLAAQQQAPVSVRYRGSVVGEFFADVLVEGLVIVELKAVKTLEAVHQAQLMNYLRASRLRVGLLLNFAVPRIQIKRIVLD